MPDPAQFPEAEQERVRMMLRSIDVSAPAGLRASIEEQIRAAGAPRRRFRFRPPIVIPAVAAGAVAAVVLAVVLISGGGGTLAAPSLSQASALALSQPTAPAPGSNGHTLDISSGGVSFPNWQPSAGWRAVGSRSQTVAGRHVVTVFYAGPGYGRVGYAIVSGPALAVPGAPTVTRHGITYAFLHRGSATLVTWERLGHTCVIAARTESVDTLLKLATASD